MLWWSLAGILHVFARTAFAGLLPLSARRRGSGQLAGGRKLVTEWFPARDAAAGLGDFQQRGVRRFGDFHAHHRLDRALLGLAKRFILMGLLGLVWLAGWWSTYTVPENIAAEVPSRPCRPGNCSARGSYACFTLSKVFMDPVWYFFVFWFPKYLGDVHHFSLQDIGWRGWIPYFSAALGNIAGGALTGSLIRGGVAVPAARKASTAVFAMLMLSTIPAILTHSASLAIALISITTFGYTGYTANTLAFPADVFPKNTVASIWGLASMGSGFGGMLFMGLSGRLIGRFGYTPVFIGYGILPLLALVCIVFFIGPLRADARFQSSIT